MKQRSTRIPFAVSSTATPEQLVEVAQRSHGAGDVGDQPFALQRLGERGGGSRARERETGLGHERLHLRELVVPEQRADGAIAAKTTPTTSPPREHRHEGAALHARELVQPLVDDRRALGVEDRERSCPRASRCLARMDTVVAGIGIDAEIADEQRRPEIEAERGQDGAEPPAGDHARTMARVALRAL